jgi:hypothetical protein
MVLWLLAGQGTPGWEATGVAGSGGQGPSRSRRWPCVVQPAHQPEPALRQWHTSLILHCVNGGVMHMLLAVLLPDMLSRPMQSFAAKGQTAVSVLDCLLWRMTTVGCRSGGLS